MKMNLSEQSLMDRIRKGEIQPAPAPTPVTTPEKKKDDTTQPVPNIKLATKLTKEAKFCKDHILSIPKFSKNKWTAIGTISHRKVAGTDVWSEHAKGNAIDWHASPADMHQLAIYLVNNFNMLHVQNVIYNRQIWNYPRGWHKYEGVDPHTSHVHVDFTPTTRKINTDTNIDSQQKIHKVIATFKNELYDMLVLNPGNYFNEFRGWILGDDEEKAFKYYWSAINKRVKDLKINTLYNSKNISKWDKYNINNLNSVVNKIGKFLREEHIGSSYTIPIIWNYPNPKTGKWQQRKITFKWDYL